MKTAIKIIAALAAIAGVVFVIATYGDKIVAWAKKLLASWSCCSDTCECVCEGEGECKCGGECKCAEEAPAPEAPEAPITEIIIEANEPVADEADFAE